MRKAGAMWSLMLSSSWMKEGRWRGFCCQQRHISSWLREKGAPVGLGGVLAPHGAPQHPEAAAMGSVLVSSPPPQQGKGPSGGSRPATHSVSGQFSGRSRTPLSMTKRRTCSLDMPW